MPFHFNNRANSRENQAGEGSHAPSHRRRALCAGFTLFEMMVSITIFVLLAGVLLVKNSQFEGTTVLTNLAYELALEVREAQSYGIDAEGYGSSAGSGVFSHAYGIHYDRASGDTQTFDLFVDNDDNYYYDASGDAIIDTSTIPSQYSIARVSVQDANNSSVFYCTDIANAGGQQLSSVDIVFKRPQPSAIISGLVGGNRVSMTSAAIYLQSQQGLVREVKIQPSGEISVVESPSLTLSSCSAL